MPSIKPYFNPWTLAIVYYVSVRIFLLAVFLSVLHTHDWWWIPTLGLMFAEWIIIVETIWAMVDLFEEE